MEKSDLVPRDNRKVHRQ